VGVVSPSRRRAFGAIKRRASGRYSASYVGPDGIRRFGGKEFATKADAQAWLAQRQSEIYTRTWTDPTLGRISLTDYGTRWIKEHQLSLRTRDLYESLFRLHIEPFLGTRAIEEIKPETVRWWRAQLLDEGRSDSTTAKAYRLLRVIFNAAIDDGRLTRNPCRIKGADREAPPERPVASVAEVFDLADRIGPRYRTFVLTAALASLRWGELVALRRRDIDLDEGLIFVRRSMVERGGSLEIALPKNSRTRIVAVPGVLVDELRSHLAEVDSDPDAPAFTGERGGTPRRGNWRANVQWASAVKGAGLPEGFRFHDLRHTGNHLAAQTGASTRELMQRMGHSTVRAAMIYQHATDARSRELADRLDALVRERRATAPGARFEGSSVPDVSR
jgi:integrase